MQSLARVQVVRYTMDQSLLEPSQRFFYSHDVLGGSSFPATLGCQGEGVSNVETALQSTRSPPQWAHSESPTHVFYIPLLV